jgi:beta-D-galactosyl-(1->4)-L-rhamnose phosphorylase
LEVEFIDFEEIKKGIPKDIKVIINGGLAGTAWSGADAWKDEAILENLTKWVYEGGTFIGVNEPSAVEGYDTFFRMAHVLGIDKDTGSKVNHGRWSYEVEAIPELLPEDSRIKGKDHLYLTDGNAKVLMEENGLPVMTANDFGKGKGIYLASFEVNLQNTRMLLNTILYGSGEKLDQNYITNNPLTECAYYPSSNKLVVINNSELDQTTTVKTPKKDVVITIEAYDTKMIDL